MWRQQRAFAGRHVGDEDVRVRPFRLLLRVDDVLSILRPDGIHSCPCPAECSS